MADPFTENLMVGLNLAQQSQARRQTQRNLDLQEERIRMQKEEATRLLQNRQDAMSVVSSVVPELAQAETPLQKLNLMMNWRDPSSGQDLFSLGASNPALGEAVQVLFRNIDRAAHFREQVGLNVAARTQANWEATQVTANAMATSMGYEDWMQAAKAGALSVDANGVRAMQPNMEKARMNQFFEPKTPAPAVEAPVQEEEPKPTMFERFFGRSPLDELRDKVKKDSTLGDLIRQYNAEKQNQRNR